MTRARLDLGRRGEALADARLATLGYEIVERNWRAPEGEIDIVARHWGEWVFAEVRARRGIQFGTPEESITPRKRAHLIASAQAYLAEHALGDVPWRIDLVAVEFSERGELLRVEVIENAIRADSR